MNDKQLRYWTEVFKSLENGWDGKVTFEEFKSHPWHYLASMKGKGGKRCHDKLPTPAAGTTLDVKTVDDLIEESFPIYWCSLPTGACPKNLKLSYTIH